MADLARSTMLDTLKVTRCTALAGAGLRCAGLHELKGLALEDTLITDAGVTKLWHPSLTPAVTDILNAVGLATFEQGRTGLVSVA